MNLMSGNVVSYKISKDQLYLYITLLSKVVLHKRDSGRLCNIIREDDINLLLLLDIPQN